MAVKKKTKQSSSRAVSAREDARFRAEMDLSTLQRADEVRKDSTRMTAVKKHANEQVKVIKKVSN